MSKHCWISIIKSYPGRMPKLDQIEKELDKDCYTYDEGEHYGEQITSLVTFNDPTGWMDTTDAVQAYEWAELEWEDFQEMWVLVNDEGGFGFETSCTEQQVDEAAKDAIRYMLEYHEWIGEGDGEVEIEYEPEPLELCAGTKLEIVSNKGDYYIAKIDGLPGTYCVTVSDS